MNYLRALGILQDHLPLPQHMHIRTCMSTLQFGDFLERQLIYTKEELETPSHH